MGSFKPAEIMTVLRTGRTSQIALIATFAATLFLPVAAAVGVGVVLSLLLQLNQETIDLKVVRLVPDARGSCTEAEVPKTLADGDVVILDVYGSLFYAGARTLQLRLPDPADSPARRGDLEAARPYHAWRHLPLGDRRLRAAAAFLGRPALPEWAGRIRGRPMGT